MTYTARSRERWTAIGVSRRMEGASRHDVRSKAGAGLASRALYGLLLCNEMTWLPEAFTHPERVDLPTGHHVRPLREADVDIDYPAVMGSRERLWAKYGEALGWPPATLSYEADREDLARHEAEIAADQAFSYAVLDERETELFGCVYIYPAQEWSPPGSDAVASWWVVDQAAETELERALDSFVPRWLTDTWRFKSVHYLR